MFTFTQEQERWLSSCSELHAMQLAETGTTAERVVLARVRSEYQILADLVHDDCDAVRQQVAENQAISSDLIDCLVEDGEVAVRASLAHNPAVLARHMAVLAGDQSWEVRRAAAFWGPPMVVTVLSKDSMDLVRWAAAWNPLLPTVDRERLAQTDPEEAVRRAAITAMEHELRAQEREAQIEG